MNRPLPVETALTLFVSYSRRDTAAADALVAALEARGMKVFIDRRDLPYGEQWQAELADSIASADTVIWLVSPNSVASKWCNWELDEVQKQHKRLVPVRVGPVVPEQLPRQLGAIHILPAEGEFDQAQHLDTLVQVLETDRAWLKEHTRLLDRAQQWLAKDRGDGLLLRGRALADAVTWQTHQPRRAPPPSPAVLDLIVNSQKGAQRRQRTLIGSLAAGLVVAVGLSVLAFWQSQVAAAESRRATAESARATAEAERATAEAQRVIRATALSGWRAFNEPLPACKAMKQYTGEEGLRALYCYVRDTLGYAQLEAMSGMKIFLSGPHTNGKLKVRANTFGHYNPDFVVWVGDHLLPQPDDKAYLGTTQPIYDRFMRNQLRAYHRTYVGWSHSLHHFDQERRYLMDMIDGRRPWSYLGGRFQEDTLKSLLGIDAEAEKLNFYHLDTAVRYWQRRSIDGTADEFFALIEKVMGIYDPAWLAQAPRPAGNAPHLPAPGEPITQARDPAKPPMPVPTGVQQQFNDEMVIE